MIDLYEHFEFKCFVKQFTRNQSLSLKNNLKINDLSNKTRKLNSRYKIFTKIKLTFIIWKPRIKS